MGGPPSQSGRNRLGNSSDEPVNDIVLCRMAPGHKELQSEAAAATTIPTGAGGAVPLTNAASLTG